MPSVVEYNFIGDYEIIIYQKKIWKFKICTACGSDEIITIIENLGCTEDKIFPRCRRCTVKYNLHSQKERKRRIGILLLKMKGYLNDDYRLV